MDTSSTINSKNPTRSTAKVSLRRVSLQVDVTFLVIVAFIIVLGLLMVYSASWNYALRIHNNANYVIFRQIGWVLLGGLAILGLSRVDYHILQHWSLYLLIGALLLLVAVLLFGETLFGSRRTLLSGGSIQPSEFAKLAIIIYLSVWLYSKRDNLNNMSFGLFPMMIILGITSGLILGQPDLSAAITVIMLGTILFFIAGGDIWQILMVVLIAAIFGFIVFMINQTGRTRMTDYINGLQDPGLASDHIKRSIEAIVRGGLFGVGIGKGQSKFTGLPLSWSDSIFAIITEETGIIGAGVVALLFIAFLWRGLIIAQHAPDQLGKLLAGGLTLWISLEALINMGVMVNLLPHAGNALPMISAGGSSMLANLIGIGVITSVSRTSNVEKSKTEGSKFGAVIDLRRRDGRGRISRARRPSGTRK
jgi:cell division protein FtsW